ncbi:MAG: hypothetical protein LBR96_02325 [Treponema sp.]|jgi:hypothetical protein|nr:hypothetical protein [Treponema sp.]
MKNAALLLLIVVLPVSFLPAQKRSITDIYPGLDGEQLSQVFSEEGLLMYSERSSPLRLYPQGLDRRFEEILSKNNPLFQVETLTLIPNSKNNLDIYNALNDIRALKGRIYHSATRNEDIPLFEEAARIESPKNTSPVADPPPVETVPPHETVYICLKDANFGNSYYRADMYLEDLGILYSLVNFRNLSFLFIPVIKEEKFLAQFYFEPVHEGIMIYGFAGADVAGFIANRIDIPSAVRKRVKVIIDWVKDGLN